MYCQKCGQPVPDIKTNHNGWTTMRQMENSTALVIPQSTGQSQPAFSEAYRRTPFRKLEMGADVLVPLTQAVVSGVLSVIILAMMVPFVPGWGWGVPFVVGGFVIALVWVWAMFKDRGLWIIEEITGMDIDKDGYTGKPQQRTVKIDVSEGHGQSKLAALPGDERDLARFCRMVTGGDPFTEETATASGYGVTNLRKLRTLFINSRWAYWKNPEAPQQGIELTLSGKKIVSDLSNDLDIALSDTPLSPPDLDIL